MLTDKDRTKIRALAREQGIINPSTVSKVLKCHYSTAKEKLRDFAEEEGGPKLNKGPRGKNYSWNFTFPDEEDEAARTSTQGV